MTTEQDVNFAQWFNMYYGDPRKNVVATRAQLNRMIKRGLSLYGIAVTKENRAQALATLQSVSLAIAAENSFTIRHQIWMDK